MTSSSKTAWLFSPARDVLAFGGSALASLLLIALGARLGLLDDGTTETPEWAWLACVVLVDVAHVWGNLLLVYTDREELRRDRRSTRSSRIGALAIGTALASEDELFFWRALAALAVVHFVRQQVGWVKLYRAKNRELDDGAVARVVDEGAVYAATLAPVVWWHAHLPRSFSWLIANDFFVGLPDVAGVVALVIEAAFLLAYAAKSASSWRAGRGNPGKDLVVVTTALLWWLGIVALNSDFAFTVTNVLIHGVPYMFLIAAVSARRGEAGANIARPLAVAARFGVAGVFVALAVCGLVEEGAWDRLVWHEHTWLYPVAAVDASSSRFVLVPLLALPQITHYVLDAFLWRRRDNPYV